VEQLESILNSINSVVWGVPMLVLLLGTHLYLTVRLRFVQRYIGKAIRLSVSPAGEGDGDISHFSALTTALAATIGTGNIVGVATAVSLGGPGAVFWIWVTGVLGIATKYSEALLAIKYRVVTPRGSFAGGPMYVLERGLGQKWLGMLFALFTAIAAFGIGNLVQSNAIADSLQSGFNVPVGVTGVVLAILTALVILGGIHSIARVCSVLVPFMAIFYITGCVALLAFGWQTLGQTIVQIFASAFTGQAAVGGFVGASIMVVLRAGVARGIFSNESGLGSAPIVAAAAHTRNPVRQALVSASGTFWDTVIICALTGLVIVNSGIWQEGVEANLLTQRAFGAIPLGSHILTVALLTFVFSTIIGWSYYGEKAVEYLIGTRAVMPYRVAWVIVVMVGAVTKSAVVWTFSDIANAFMAVPNLIALLLLSGVVVAETRTYLWEDRLDESEEAVEARASVEIAPSEIAP
jgi:AGCS family alanine or glycine:cation symporter